MALRVRSTWWWAPTGCTPTRRLAFGPEAQFISFLGHYIAGFDLPNYLNLDHGADLQRSREGSGYRQRARRHKTSAGFVFASEPFEYDRHDPEQQKKILADVYAGVGWEVPG